MTSFVTMTTRKILPSDWPKVYFHLLKPDKFQIVYLGENNKNRPRLLTPIVGVNNRHKSAIDTDSVSTIATNRLLTPTNDSFHLLSAEMRRRGTHASLDFLCDGSALIRPRSQRLLVSAGTGSVLMRFTMVCRNVRGVYDATVLSLGLAIPTPVLRAWVSDRDYSEP